jgi:hypothetical protein
MSEEYKKELKIVNSYGAVLQKFAGHFVINEKHLSYKKKDIQKAIKMLLTRTILANEDYDLFITGYMQLGLFQKYQDVSGESIVGTTPEEYLKKLKKGSKNQKKNQKMMDKANAEQNELYKEINFLAKVIKEKAKSK